MIDRFRRLRPHAKAEGPLQTGPSADTRYDVGLTIGPCSEDEADALADAILELFEAKAVGAGAVSIRPYKDEDATPVGAASSLRLDDEDVA